MQHFKFHYTHIKYVYELLFRLLVYFNSDCIKRYSFPKVYVVFTFSSSYTKKDLTIFSIDFINTPFYSILTNSILNEMMKEKIFKRSFAGTYFQIWRDYYMTILRFRAGCCSTCTNSSIFDR